MNFQLMIKKNKIHLNVIQLLKDVKVHSNVVTILIGWHQIFTAVKHFAHAETIYLELLALCKHQC